MAALTACNTRWLQCYAGMSAAYTAAELQFGDTPSWICHVLVCAYIRIVLSPAEHLR